MSTTFFRSSLKINPAGIQNMPVSLGHRVFPGLSYNHQDDMTCLAFLGTPKKNMFFTCHDCILGTKSISSMICRYMGEMIQFDDFFGFNGVKSLTIFPNLTVLSQLKIMFGRQKACPFAKRKLVFQSSIFRG